MNNYTNLLCTGLHVYMYICRELEEPYEKSSLVRRPSSKEKRRVSTPLTTVVNHPFPHCHKLLLFVCIGPKATVCLHSGSSGRRGDIRGREAELF